MMQTRFLGDPTVVVAPAHRWGWRAYGPRVRGWRQGFAVPSVAPGGAVLSPNAGGSSRKAPSAAGAVVAVAALVLIGTALAK